MSKGIPIYVLRITENFCQSRCSDDVKFIYKDKHLGVMPMNWLRKFMVGRYGGDQLSMVLLICAILLNFIVRLIHIPLLTLLGYVPFGIAVYRILSRNTAKRSMENYKFTKLMSPINTWFKITQNRIRDVKTHRYFTCRNCGQSLRVPKGKGKIVVICPKCKREFIEKT